MTVMTETTKTKPKIGINNPFPENIAILAAKPPSASDPVSPINTEAGDTLKIKYANKAPTKQKDKTDKDVSPFCKRSTLPKEAKKGTHEPAANPSNPSVKFTAFTVAKNTKTEKGIIPNPISHFVLKKGTFTFVKPDR